MRFLRKNHLGMLENEKQKAAAKLQALHRGRSTRRVSVKVVVPPALVLTGPCGMGKSRLLQAFLERQGDDFKRPVSHTSRAARPGEVHGVDYFFIPVERMRTLIGRGSFAEHVEIDGILHATSHAALLAVAKTGHSPALCISVAGALQLREAGGAAFEGAKFVFAGPESMPEYEAKLRSRGVDTEAAIRRKLRASREEMLTLSSGRGADCFEDVLFASEAPLLLDDLTLLAAELRPLSLAARAAKAGLSQLGLVSGSSQLAFLSLALPRAQLSALPLLAHYPHLQRLELSDSRLDTLGGVCTLTKLLYLSVDGNRLSGAALAAPLPSTLLSLDASRNAISSMEGIGRLIRLEQLELQSNAIDAVREVSRLPSLALLSLGANKLRGETLELPVSLHSLGLEQNAIPSLAPLLPLPHLHTLDAASNALADVGGLASKCPALTSLDLSHNQLANAAPLATLGSVHGLRQLDLRGNPLSTAPDYALAALYPLLMLAELDGKALEAEDKVRAMNANGYSDEALAAIRRRFFPPAGAAEAARREDDAAVALQSTFKGHSTRTNLQKRAEEQQRASLRIQARFRGNRERELTDAYFSRIA